MHEQTEEEDWSQLPLLNDLSLDLSQLVKNYLYEKLDVGGAKKNIRKKKDSRGRHDKAYRERLRAGRRELCNHFLHPDRVCSYCGEVDHYDELFTDDGTCRACGTVNDIGFLTGSDYVSRFHRYMAHSGYNAIFYCKERLNNFAFKCPAIKPKHLFAISVAIVERTSGPIGFNVRELTRSLIYAAVNHLYGAKKPGPGDDERGVQFINRRNRKHLVYRERWHFIKRWMCAQPGLCIEDGDKWMWRAEKTLPRRELIDLLERMIKVLEIDFLDILYAIQREPNTHRRHNRPCRDIVVLFLMHGIHPVLTVLYGTDFWKPPKTEKSKRDNVARFKILLARARERAPYFRWPSMDLELEDILSTRSAEYDPSEFKEGEESVMPYWMTAGTYHREDYELWQ